MTPEQVHASQILMLEDLKKKVEGERKNTDYGDNTIYDKARRQEYGFNSALSTVTERIDEMINKLKV